MIELTCKSCKEKVGVESFLAAAQQPCRRCGQLLMGPLSRGGRTVRPAAFDGALPSAAEFAAAYSFETMPPRGQVHPFSALNQANARTVGNMEGVEKEIASL